MKPHGNTRHGHGRSGKNHNATPTYNTWAMMKNRCFNIKASNYARYGGRGIKVCKRWIRFDNFLADMGIRPQGKTIDRIDVNGPYSLENCRWASLAEQQRNARRTVYVTFQGKTECLSYWSEKFGINKDTLVYRLKKWPIERAFFTKAKYGNRITQSQKVSPQLRAV